MRNPDINIRPYNRQDLERIRDIAYDTAFMGDSASVFFDNKKIFCDWLMRYYTDYEPGHLLIADYQGLAVGYLSGCFNTREYRKIFNRKILPGLIKQALCSLEINSQLRRMALSITLSFFKGEFNKPDFLLTYPAHLHINLEKDFRHKGIGSELIAKFLDTLKANNISGVHAWTFSPTGAKLFEKTGFELLFRRKITWFDYWADDKEIYLNCYGMKIG